MTSAYYLTIETSHDPSKPLELHALYQIIYTYAMYFDVHNN
jgi:hypothetical protein